MSEDKLETQPIKIEFFADGGTMAFENGEQVPIAQKHWILVFAEYLAANGIDPEQQEFTMSSGRSVEIIKDDYGYNFRLI